MRRFVLAAAICGGCATTYPELRVQHLDKQSPELDEAAAERADEMEGTPDVAVAIEKYPEGLWRSEDGSQLIVGRGFEHRYWVIGSIKADYGNRSLGPFSSLWWTWKREKTWLKVLCYGQMPLQFATLGLWTFVSPTSYPCFPIVPDRKERRQTLVRLLQRAAAAMGANLVVVTEITDRVEVHQGGASIPSPEWAMSGYAVVVSPELETSH